MPHLTYRIHIFMKYFIFITFIFSLVFTQAVFADKVEPPKDAVAFRGNHYKAFLDTNSTWWEAKFACDDIGGELWSSPPLRKTNLYAVWLRVT